MGAIKENNYTQSELNLFLIARAFAHPARIKMLTELLIHRSYRNIDLAQILKLSKPAVKNHIQMLKDAELIQIEYSVHFYRVNLSHHGLEWGNLFLSKRTIN